MDYKQIDQIVEKLVKLHLMNQSVESKEILAVAQAYMILKCKIEDQQTMLCQTGFNINRMYEDGAIKEKAYLVLKNRNDLSFNNIRIDKTEGEDYQDDSDSWSGGFAENH